ncbi:hypothetical protein [Burkholderia ambifaria]|uniref:hypothetical protein n=1 Tax=Burkholderia ambifaria TaxID=152480 RepID=UPI00158C7186|nr:hypothetical protein [Burkholderia ambifaria]MBR8220077.1 hypothetical protein [Burkholderia ambifaria]
MEFLLILVLVWLYNAFRLINLPCKVVRRRWNSQDIWTFVSLGRLFRLALVYFITAPIPLLILWLIMASGASGGPIGGISESTQLAAWVALWIFLFAASVALLLSFFRLLRALVVKSMSKASKEN